MKVLVTGGSGFIGARLVKALIKTNYKIRLASRNPQQKISDDHLEIVKCDLLNDTFDFTKLLHDCSVVFNCAGELHDEEHMHKLHVDSTKRLILACKIVADETKTPIHFVQLSSVGAYGPNNSNATRVVTEETKTAPNGTYEITKTQADELIISSAEENLFSYTILRPSNVYGPNMPNGSLRQLGNIIKKKLFFYVGAPGAISTYIHVDDVIDALVLCGKDPRAKNNVFNISNDCHQEVLIDAMATALGVKKPKLRLPEKPVRIMSMIFSNFRMFPLSQSRIDALVSRTTYPTDKIYRVLAFKPTRKIEDAIGDVFMTINQSVD